MGTILASQSLAGGATVTSGAFPFSVYDDITATVLNANPPPNQSPMVTLLLSADNVNYVAADRRIIGQTPSQAFYHIFALQNFAGFIPGAPGWDFLTGADVFTGTATGLTAAAVNTVQSFKLKFENLGTVAVTVAANDGCSQNIAVIPLTGVSATTGGAVAAWAPPGGGRVIILRAVLDVTTKSTGAANLSIGVGASATTSSTTLFPVVVAVGSAAVLTDNISDPTAVPPLTSACLPLASGSYVTVTGSATTVGLVGNLYIQYLKP